MSQNISELVDLLSKDFNDFLGSGQYYVTEEIADEVKAILDGIRKFKLEASLMPRQLNNDLRYEADLKVQLLRQGNVMLREIKNDLSGNFLNKSNEIEVRRTHYNARARLRAFIESLNPFTYGTHVRLENYSNQVGVTDRFTNYRHHMATQYEQRTPLSAWSVWSDYKRLPVAPKFTTPHWKSVDLIQKNETTPRRPQTSFQIKNTNEDLQNKSRPYSAQGSHADSNQSLDNIVIASGMIPHFPDRSEYTYSFPRPVVCKPARFTINPQQDQSRWAGRPFKSATVDAKSTEYQNRYQIPDGAKIDRFPWVKHL